jgi:hypothetical protein
MFIDSRSVLSLFARLPLVAPNNFKEIRFQFFVGALKADSKSTDAGKEFNNFDCH